MWLIKETCKMCSVGEAPGTSLGTPASPNEPFVVVLEKGFLKNEISPSGMDFEICNFVDLFMPKHTHYTLTKIQKVKKHNRTPLNHRFWTKYHSLFFRLKFFPRFLQWKKVHPLLSSYIKIQWHICAWSVHISLLIQMRWLSSLEKAILWIKDSLSNSLNLMF